MESGSLGGPTRPHAGDTWCCKQLSLWYCESPNTPRGSSQVVTVPVQRQQNAPQCPECGIPLLGKHCHECGGKLPNPHDLTIKHFLHEGLHEFTHLDSKIFRTLRMLISSPGTLTVEYLAGRKRRYVLPLRLFILVFALNFFLYTRPGVALYDVHALLSLSSQRAVAEQLLEHRAEKLHQSKEAVFEKINEHWQHNASLFQLGDVFFFAVALAVINRRRYFGEHLIFSLHTFSFTLLFGSLTWLYYLRYGLRQNSVLVLITLTVFFVYLWRAIPKVYASTGWKAALKALLLVISLELSRGFFVTFTMFLAFFQTFSRR
jgi:hypothetical protein